MNCMNCHFENKHEIVKLKWLQILFQSSLQLQANVTHSDARPILSLVDLTKPDPFQPQCQILEGISTVVGMGLPHGKNRLR